MSSRNFDVAPAAQHDEDNRKRNTNNEDWKINVHTPEKVTIPSFIRLFTIARIFKNCDINRNKIENLVLEIKDLKQRQMAQDILLRLINDGIKKYMEKWLNENLQIRIIEIIFQTIILKKFGKEFANITTYVGNEDSKDSEHYQTLVFNTYDLMCLIFQYMEFDFDSYRDLIKCSLVNSNWLYQSWDPSSIYHFCLDRLIVQTKEILQRKLDNMRDSDCNCTDDNIIDNINTTVFTSKWQRIVNAKSIDISLDDRYDWKLVSGNKCDEYIFGKLSMLRSIINLELRLWPGKIPILNIVGYYNKENIQCLDAGVISSEYPSPAKKNVLSPLKLPNATYIRITNVYFYTIWTHRCQRLEFCSGLKQIDQKWFEYIKDNCDSSGVQRLHIDRMYFDKSIMNTQSESIKLLLKQFAQTFKSLKYLDMFSSDLCLILLLKYLCSIIKKNDTQVTLWLGTNSTYFDLFREIVEETGIKIGRLEIWVHKNMSMDWFKAIILNNRKIEYLSFHNNGFNCVKHGHFIEQLTTEVLDSDKFESLKAICINDSHDREIDINTVNKLLALKWIQENKSLVDISLHANGTHSSDFMQSFETMCKNVFSLMVTQRMAVDIDITIDCDNIQSSHVKHTYYPVFKKYFHQKSSNWKEYKPPIGNKYCILRDQPFVSFSIDGDDYSESDSENDEDQDQDDQNDDENDVEDDDDSQDADDDQDDEDDEDDVEDDNEDYIPDSDDGKCESNFVLRVSNACSRNIRWFV